MSTCALLAFGDSKRKIIEAPRLNQRIRVRIRSGQSYHDKSGSTSHTYPLLLQPINERSFACHHNTTASIKSIGIGLYRPSDKREYCVPAFSFKQHDFRTGKGEVETIFSPLPYSFGLVPPRVIIISHSYCHCWAIVIERRARICTKSRRPRCLRVGVSARPIIIQNKSGKRSGISPILALNKKQQSDTTSKSRSTINIQRTLY